MPSVPKTKLHYELVTTTKFARTFTVEGNMDNVFELCGQCISDTKFRVVKRIMPTHLILQRGNVSGSLFSFKIDKVKTVLTVSFTQVGEDVRVRCNYETSYGRMITKRDESVLENEVARLKNCLRTALQKWYASP